MKTIHIGKFEKMSKEANEAAFALKSVLISAGVGSEPAEIILDGGVYDIYSSELSHINIHISNTLSPNDKRENGEIVSTERSSPFLLEGMSNVTVDGRGALIKCHGKMTQILLKDCENITFKNISFDYVNPTVTEMTVVSSGEDYLDFRVSSSYPYKIVDGKLIWYGDNFSFSAGISQLFDPKSGLTWRHYGPIDDKNARFEELNEGLIRIYYGNNGANENPYEAKIGYILQMRDPTRDECGIIISGCKNTSFINVTMHFMNGLGFIAQNSENIRLDGFNAYPSVGRTASCAADFMHFSGCRGKISIENGYFIGAHDDAVNVHGTHLKITEVNRSTNEIKIRFMHSQTYGIGGFFAGDEIGAINPETLLEVAKARVTAVCEHNPFEIVLTVDSAEGFETGLMAENISANAEVIIKNNHFERIPTRGILITTRRPVLIENNEFEAVTGCGVLIADDARSWYESGHVTDVTVKNNIYRASSDSFIRIEPECVPSSEAAVHSGIKILNNLIEISATDEVVYAKNTDGLAFKSNTVYGDPDDCKITLNNVQNAVICDNVYNGKEWHRYEKNACSVDYVSDNG